MIDERLYVCVHCLLLATILKLKSAPTAHAMVKARVRVRVRITIVLLRSSVVWFQKWFAITFGKLQELLMALLPFRLIFEAMKNGQSLKAASRVYGVPTRTLRRHRDAKVLRPGFAIFGRHKSVFPAEYEQLLMQQIVAMEQAFYGLTTLDLRRLAFELAEKMQLKHPFSQHQRMAGCEWLRAFLKRNPQLSIRSPQATGISRVVGFNKPKVDKFFQVYGDELAKHKFDAKNMEYG